MQLTRDERAPRRTIEQAVDQVITTQRLTAPLRLEVKPVGAKVRLVDSRGNARDLTDAERDGSRELRVFLGTCSVHVEKPGYLARDTSVIVTQAGAQLSVELKNQPVAVKFEWTPEGTRVKVDGEEVDGRDRVIELSEGPHRVEAFARTASYESTVFPIEVRVGMEPVRIALQRLTGSGCRRRAATRSASMASCCRPTACTPRPVRRGGAAHHARRPYRDGAELARSAALAAGGGGAAHGNRSFAAAAVAGPGAVIGTLGLVSALAGGALFIVGYTQPICTRQPDCEALFKPDIPGGLLVGIGGGADCRGKLVWLGRFAPSALPQRQAGGA